jgi:hypothetical protein
MTCDAAAVSGMSQVSAVGLGTFSDQELVCSAAGRPDHGFQLAQPQRTTAWFRRPVAGDKAGNWTRWYRDAIKLAEDRYARFLATPPEEIQ